MASNNPTGKRGQKRGVVDRKIKSVNKENTRPQTVGQSANHGEVLTKYQDVLQRCTHINIQVIVSLWSAGVIGDRLKEALVADTNLFNRNELCYSHLKKQPTDIFNKFVLQMKKNEQKHVANQITGSKKGQLPLSQSNYDHLKNISPILIRGIVDDGSELVTLMNSSRESPDTDYAISDVEREEIQDETNRRERNNCLVSAVLRRTDFSFDCLKKALIQTGNGHLVKYMNEGVVVGTRVETNDSAYDEALSRLFEEQLDLQSSDRLSSEEERPIREALTDLSNQNIPCVGAESGHSILVYTYCRTTEDIRKYVQMFRSGQLHSQIDDIFQCLFKMSRLQSSDVLQVKVTITDEYKRIIEEVTGINDFSAADGDVNMPLGDALFHAGANVTSNYSSAAADADIQRSPGTDAAIEDATGTSSAMNKSASDITSHVKMATDEDPFVAKPFQNVHGPLDVKRFYRESMAALMPRHNCCHVGLQRNGLGSDCICN